MANCQYNGVSFSREPQVCQDDNEMASANISQGLDKGSSPTCGGQSLLACRLNNTGLNRSTCPDIIEYLSVLLGHPLILSTRHV